MFNWKDTSLVLTDQNNLYVGGFEAAKNHEQYQITAVITAVSYNLVTFPDHVTQLVIPAEDYEEYKMIDHWDDTYEFIEKYLKTRNLLVHCAAGVSRSVSIVCAYLIKKKNMTPQQALDFIKAKRNCAGPNNGFMNQLTQYYNKLNGKV